MDRNSGLWVAGIGASAGGVEALLLLFSHLRPGANMAYVVAQHMARDAAEGHDRLLASLIGKEAALPVRLVLGEPQKLEPDTIFLVAAGRDGFVAKGCIHAQQPTEKRLSLPSVDALFGELARSFGPRCVGVILSGVGSDGVLGCSEIKRHKGYTLVQNPDEARFSGMPLAAINGHHVDAVLNVGEIARRLQQWSAPPAPLVSARSACALQPDADSPGADQRQEALERIIAEVRKVTGTDFSRYKRDTLQRQLERRKKTLNLAADSSYEACLKSNPDEPFLLREHFLISVSSFFRDGSSFDALRTHLARLVAARNAGEPIRVWSAACGRGEEAYSLACMILTLTNRHPLQVLGTDLSQKAIDHARAGVYQKNAFRGACHSPDGFWSESPAGGFVIGPELRRQVEFECADILLATPPGPFDLVSCRNLLIYLGESAQDALLASFHAILRPGGLLFLGQSESPGLGAERYFAPLDFSHRVFARRTQHSTPAPGQSRIPP